MLSVKFKKLAREAEMLFFWRKKDESPASESREVKPRAKASICNFSLPNDPSFSEHLDLLRQQPLQQSSDGKFEIAGELVSGFQGADLYLVKRIVGLEPGSIVLADLRVCVAHALETGIAEKLALDGVIAPGKSSIWSEGWSAFAPLEKVTWAVAALTDSLLAIAQRFRIPISIATTGDPKHPLYGQHAGITLDPGGWPVLWSEDDRAHFDCIAHATQVRAGIWDESRPRFRPSAYGNFWLTYDGGLPWYEWMHEGRKASHQNCLEAIAEASSVSGTPVSVMDVGCGMGVGYGDALRSHRFYGIDLEPRSITWCQQNRSHPGHTYLCRDILHPKAREELASFNCDFVFSSGTIDNTWSIEAYLDALASMTQRWLFIAAYRGYYPSLPVHRYNWQPSTSAYYNDISPRQIELQLRKLGFKSIDISPLPTGNPPPQSPLETRILAEK